MESLSHLHRRAARPWKEIGAAGDRRSTRLSSGDEKSIVRFPSERSAASYDASRLTCEFMVGDGDGDGEQKPVLLPVVVRRSGKSSRCVWDGANLSLVDLDRASPATGERFTVGLSRLVRELFVPTQVPENYMGYLRWKFVHRLLSSSLHVLATQAMFRAIGIGSSHALSSAAALNWLLKDGLGRLSRCIYTASLGSAFDTNLKRVRFSSSILFSLSIGIELLTPLFPHQFLLLATLANVAKSISLAAYMATGSAIHRSFAVADNIGEVSAKAQTVCFDNLGLVLAALLNALCGKNRRFQLGVNLAIYPIFAAVELFAIYQALKHVHLHTLTKNRLEIIMDAWIQSGRIPSPAEVNEEEGIDLLNQEGNKPWPIRIGCVDPRFKTAAFSLPSLQCLGEEEPYFISVETALKRWTRKPKERILVSFREGGGTSEVILGVLQACLIRRELAGGGVAAAEWARLAAETRRRAAEDVTAVAAELRKQGWATKNVLLTSEEQARYSLVEEG
ncbi:root UVB sensitive protein (Protein of unknown function, DUF647) isoform X2 [Wolffia australiana]